MHSQSNLPVEVIALGSHLPDRVLSNFDLERMVDTSDEWIFPRTGIRQRRLVAEDEATSDLAIEAARQALERSELAPTDLDVILVATCTPDHLFPATACMVQAALGATNAMAFDLEAACSGFAYGFSVTAGMIAAGLAEHVMVIGAEALSRFTDYQDRGSCILFGDGAGAAILGPSAEGGELLYTEMGADGSDPEVLIIPAGGSRRPPSPEALNQRKHYMQLQGREVFKRAVNKMIELLRRIPEQTGVELSEISMVIPHQSNVRIINSALERAGMELDKAYLNIERVGNTSAASIPLAMDEAVQRGELERGDLVLLLAFGGGLTWASTLLRY